MIFPAMFPTAAPAPAAATLPTLFAVWFIARLAWLTPPAMMIQLATVGMAPVQFSAAKMQLEFLFGDRGRLAMDAYKANLKQTANQEVPKTFRKQELTEKSRLELEAGGTVKVSGLVDKKGKAYQGYITWKPGEKPAFMFPKDYKAALEEGRVKPAVENEVQVAVNSEGKTVEATRNLKEALQSAQQRPTGEQKQQQERRQEQKEDRKQAQKQEQPDKPKRSRGVRR